MNGWVCSFCGDPAAGHRRMVGIDRNAAQKMPKTKALTSILCGVIVAGFIMLLGSQSVIGVAHLF